MEHKHGTYFLIFRGAFVCSENVTLYVGLKQTLT